MSVLDLPLLGLVPLLLHGCAPTPGAQLPVEGPAAPVAPVSAEGSSPPAPEALGDAPPWSPDPSLRGESKGERCDVRVIEAPDYAVFPDWGSAVEDLYRTAEWDSLWGGSQLDEVLCPGGSCPSSGEPFALGLPDAPDGWDGVFGGLFVPLGDGQVLKVDADVVAFREYQCGPEAFGERVGPDHARLVVIEQRAIGFNPEDEDGDNGCEIEIDPGCIPACANSVRSETDLVRVGERWFLVQWSTEELLDLGQAAHRVEVRLELGTGVHVEGCGLTLNLGA